MNKQMKLSRKEMIKEIRKPGRVFVTSRLTDDDEFNIEVVKADLINLLSTGEWVDTGVFFTAVRNNIGLFMGW